MAEPTSAVRFLRYDRTPQKLGVMWSAEKDRRRLVCELWTHPLGWELRALVADDLMKSQTEKTETATLDVADAWLEQAVGRGWSRER